jgi:hypothetical protein
VSGGLTPAVALEVQASAGNAALGSLLGLQRDGTAPPAPAGAKPARPPGSALHAMPHEGHQLTDDWRQMSDLLEQMVAEKGWSETSDWAYRFLNRDKLRDPLDMDPDLVGRIEQRLRSELEQMSRKRAEYIDHFEKAAISDTSALLKNSEDRIKAESARYGLEEHGILFKDYTMNEAPKAGLQAAARELATKRRAGIRALREFQDAQKAAGPGIRIVVAPEFDEVEKKRAAWIALEDEYHALANEKQKDYPVLAAYSTRDDAAIELDKLANQDSADLAKNLYKTIADRLENIQAVRAEMEPGGRFSVWKTPQVIALTKKTMTAKPWESRVIDDHVREVKTAEAEDAKVFAAIAIGLGLLAAIPTGGTSVLAGVAAASAALGAAYSIHELYEHYKDYSFASAEAGTDFEKAQSISQEEPSLQWLAADLLDLGMNVVGAAAAFKALRAAMAAAEATRLEKLAEVIEEANRLGLDASIRAKVVATVVARAGGGSTVQASLAKILETFEKLQPTRDARLAKAFREAAQTIVAQGRVGIITKGAGSIEEIKRVLRAAGVAESDLSSKAFEIAQQFAKEPGMDAAYYKSLDIVMMREGATADVLAHELTHRAQNMLGQLDTLGTMRKEFQAFSAQREFLLMLPQKDVPMDIDWLLRATDEDIKSHVLSSYTGRLLKEIREGRTFDLFDEQADAQVAIDIFKIATRRNLM